MCRQCVRRLGVFLELVVIIPLGMMCVVWFAASGFYSVYIVLVGVSRVSKINSSITVCRTL